MSEIDARALWDRVLEALSGRIALRTIDTLLRPLDPMDATADKNGGVFLLKAPNEFSKDWAAKHYGPLIEEQLASLAGGTWALHFTLAPASDAPRSSSTPTPPPPTRKSAPPPAVRRPQPVPREASVSALAPGAKPLATGSNPSTQRSPGGISHGLHPKYTFDNFVTGPSNQLAHAASVSMVDKLGRRFNPLFLYGSTGLGKTHLMNAIGHRLLVEDPSASIVYVSAEHFTNEFVGGLQSHTMDTFRARYRQACDALLIDDVQFLSGRDGTLEEFFHTFNALYLKGKPIVLTSDVAPADLKGIPDRLISRFSSGMVVDIQPPEVDMRIAILRKKAEIENIHLDDEAALMLASNVATNVRDLEGMLMKLAIKASLAGRPGVDSALVREALRMPMRSSVVTVEDVQRAVCEHYRIKLAQLIGTDRHQGVALPRQVAMYLSRERLGTSFPQLGARFGGKDHTTVISSVKKITKLIAEDHPVKRDIDAILARLSVSTGHAGGR